MAIGGDNALLRIFKLNDPNGNASYSIGSNQTLVGHNGRILRIAWNKTFRKLCTADENGVVIVWIIEAGRFVEEMMNSSGHSPIGDIQWSPDGTKVCIAYGDGEIVVGSVGGKRLWTKSVNVSHQHVEWSPDGLCILIASTDDTISVYNESGDLVEEFDNNGASDIVGLSWYPSSLSGRNNLVIAHCFGDIYLRHDLDHDDKSMVESGLNVESCRWNEEGKIIAVCGVLKETSPNEPHASVVKLYNHHGELLSNLNLPTDEFIIDILWGSFGSLLLALENSVFFASVKTPTGSTTVGKNSVAYISSNVSTGDELIFHDRARGEVNRIILGDISFLRSNHRMCLAVVTGPPASSRSDEEYKCSTAKLHIFDDVGRILTTRSSIVKPIHIVFNDNCVVAADQRYAYIWIFGSFSDVIQSGGFNEFEIHSMQCHGLDRVYDCNNESEFPFMALNKFSVEGTQGITIDTSISALDVSNGMLFVGKEDGSIDVLDLTKMCLIKRIQMPFVSRTLAVTKDSTTIACFDDTAKIIRIYETGINQKNGEDVFIDFNLIFEQESGDYVCSVMWASDITKQLLIQENDVLSIVDCELRQVYQMGVLQPREYVSDFCNETVTCGISLEFDGSHVDAPVFRSQMLETKVLKEMKASLEEQVEGDEDMCGFILSHYTLSRAMLKWIARFALERFYLKAARRVYAILQDYEGVLFLERLGYLTSEDENRRHIHHLIQSDSQKGAVPRSDHDPFKSLETKVKALINSGDLQEAMEYLMKSNVPLNTLKSICDAVDKINLVKLGYLFQSAGLYNLAIETLTQVDSDLAADLSMQLNRWGDAIRLATSDKRKEIKDLVQNLCDKFIANGNEIQAGILYNQVGMHLEGAALWERIAVKKAQGNPSDISSLKLLCCLAGHELNNHYNAILSTSVYSRASMKHQPVIPLSTERFERLMSDSSKSNPNDNQHIWHKASAYHFLILCHEQMIKMDYNGAMMTALKCVDFLDVICEKQIFSLIVLTSYKCGNFGRCSWALIKLKTIAKDDELLSSKLQKLVRAKRISIVLVLFKTLFINILITFCLKINNLKALDIFRNHDPIDKQTLPSAYLGNGNKTNSCAFCGRLIIHEESVQCQVCLNFMIVGEMKGILSCPVCLAQIKDSKVHQGEEMLQKLNRIQNL